MGFTFFLLCAGIVGTYADVHLKPRHPRYAQRYRDAAVFAAVCAAGIAAALVATWLDPH